MKLYISFNFLFIHIRLTARQLSAIPGQGGVGFAFGGAEGGSGSRSLPDIYLTFPSPPEDQHVSDKS